MNRVDENNFVIFKAHNILGINKEEFSDYIFNLGEAIDFKIYDLASLLFAIRLRVVEYRNQNCRIIDKIVEPEQLKEVNFDEADDIFKKALNGEETTVNEREKYGSYMIKYFQEVAGELGFLITIIN